VLGASRLAILALIAVTVAGLFALPELIRGDDPTVSLEAIELRPRSEAREEALVRKGRRSRPNPAPAPEPAPPEPAPSPAPAPPATEDDDGDDGDDFDG
jgi:hypothetical protein